MTSRNFTNIQSKFYSVILRVRQLTVLFVLEQLKVFQVLEVDGVETEEMYDEMLEIALRTVLQKDWCTQLYKTQKQVQLFT